MDYWIKEIKMSNMNHGWHGLNADFSENGQIREISGLSKLCNKLE